MVLPRVVEKKRTKEGKKKRKAWNGLLNVSNGHKHINHPGLLPKSRKTTAKPERRKVQKKESNSKADVWMHATDGSRTGKLASIIKGTIHPAPVQHTLTFCSLRLRHSLKGISMTIHEELRSHPGKGHGKGARLVMFSNFKVTALFQNHLIVWLMVLELINLSKVPFQWRMALKQEDYRIFWQSI